MVVPVARLNRASLRALAYAASLGQPTLAVHLAPEDAEADRFRDQWRAWGDHVRLEIDRVAVPGGDRAAGALPGGAARLPGRI